jgi:hypothetical protein
MCRQSKAKYRSKDRLTSCIRWKNRVAANGAIEHPWNYRSWATDRAPARVCAAAGNEVAHGKD